MNEIGKARLETGIRITDIARLIGAPYRTVQNWCDGSANPPLWLQRLVVEKIRQYAALLPPKD